MAPKIFIHPDRPKQRFRPFKALGHLRKLLADKEDTEQVFHIFEALPRKGFVDDARSFVESPRGQKLMASEPFLPTMLDDHATLATLPAGTVGRAYMDFMQREGLSAAGLVAESVKMNPDRPNYGDQIGWYGERMRDTHDLFHVLTGYGRDALGEQCVLGFTYGQNRNLGNLFIAYLGGLDLRRRVKASAPVIAAIREGQRHGTAAGKIVQQDITSLLREPLEAARKRLKIGAPSLYVQAHQTYHAAGIDPYNFLAAAA